MKKLINSYGSFTRTERLGLICLCGLLIILLSIRASMHLWVHQPIDTEKEKKLVASWEVFKRSQPAVKKDTADDDKRDYVDAAADADTPMPDVININTADSATLVRLKGIGPVSARKIVARRKNKGPFTNVNQLMEVCSMPDATFEVLKRHLSVDSSR